MKIALEKWGYNNADHFSSVFKNRSHPELWTAALRAKFEPGVPSDSFTIEDWDNLLGDCDVR